MTELVFRARTHSDPDLPQLLPLPLRPHSSYDPKLEIREHAQFPEDVVEAMAKKLGVDIASDPELRWVVRDCLLTLDQDGWKCDTSRGELFYTHPQTGEVRPFHTAEETHRELAEHLRVQNKEFEQEKMDRFYRIKAAVFKTIMGERDVRAVCTISVMEDVLEALNVDVQDEPFLILRVKTAIEDAYFRMKQIGPHFIHVNNCIDVHSLVVHLELDRVDFLKKISPTGLLYCVQCETALADVACASCHDCFCNNCMIATHSSGHRMDHPAVFIEQVVCSECERKSALVRCQDCVELFCYDCFVNTHREGKRLRHCVRLPCTTFCYNCDEREASYMCDECEDLICTKCNVRIHRKGARQNHTLYGLRKAAYSRKLFGNNLDRLMKIVQTKEHMSLPLSPWLLMYDEAKMPFWYNCQTREKVHANSTDLTNQPEAEDVGTADLQLIMALPGATNLLSTHAAKKATEGAVFEVPKHLQIRFASPATQQMDATAVMMGSRGFKEELQQDLIGAA
eukprot:GEMP01025192.1.p1 GENE.GEMP01025192.1~~GEMP01025192.1.p1  ORF type:complete len:519 (+),score=115.58 GEMP01025192.1:30-1559(+)